MSYENKYLKYKNKYLNLKTQLGGTNNLKYNCNKNYTDKISNYCIKDSKGKFNNLEECVFSKECLDNQYKIKNIRLIQYKYLKNILGTYSDINSQIYCIKDMSNIILKDYIASGVNGEVYNGIINNALDDSEFSNVAIKIQPLSDNEYENRMILSTIYKTESWAEIYAMKLGNKLFELNITPHISLLYGYFICNDCRYTNEQLMMKKNCVYIINELATDNLYNWRKKMHTDEEWYIMLFQIIYSLLSFHYTYGLSHGDLHTKNILFNKIDSYNTYDKYIFFNKTIIIKNNGYIFKLYDFAKATSPLIKNSIYSKDNKIIHRNKDILKLFDDLINNNNNDETIILPPQHINDLLLDTYNQLLIEPTNPIGNLEKFKNPNYINILDDLLIRISEIINNSKDNIIMNTYKLNEKKYFKDDDLKQDLDILIKIEIDSLTNQSKICKICTFENDNSNTNCEICYSSL